MINKIIYPDGRDYACDDCKKVVERFKSIDDARDAGWGIDQGRQPVGALPALHVTDTSGAAAQRQTNLIPLGFPQVGSKQKLKIQGETSEDVSPFFNTPQHTVYLKNCNHYI